MRRLIIGLIKAYRLILSPYLGNNCRFSPSCSSYAIKAVEKHGVFQGSWLAIKRILKCHPWHEGGDDPVPEKSGKKYG